MNAGCPTCGASPRQGNRYCTRCGARLPAVAGTPELELPAARLIAVHESELVEELPIRGSLVTIGRDPASDVVVPAIRASIHHARILYRDGRYWIEDLGSVNGTQLDGEVVRDPRPLHNGSIIKVGSSILKFLAGRD